MTTFSFSLKDVIMGNKAGDDKPMDLFAHLDRAASEILLYYFMVGRASTTGVKYFATGKQAFLERKFLRE